MEAQGCARCVRLDARPAPTRQESPVVLARRWLGLSTFSTATAATPPAPTLREGPDSTATLALTSAPLARPPARPVREEPPTIV